MSSYIFERILEKLLLWKFWKIIKKASLVVFILNKFELDGNKAKGRISKRVFQENKTYVCVSGGKKCSFFGKFGVFCFLETPALRFALLLYYRRTVQSTPYHYTENWLHRKCFLCLFREFSKLLEERLWWNYILVKQQKLLRFATRSWSLTHAWYVLKKNIF